MGRNHPPTSPPPPPPERVGFFLTKQWPEPNSHQIPAKHGRSEITPATAVCASSPQQGARPVEIPVVAVPIHVISRPAIRRPGVMELLIKDVCDTEQSRNKACVELPTTMHHTKSAGSPPPPPNLKRPSAMQSDVTSRSSAACCAPSRKTQNIVQVPVHHRFQRRGQGCGAAQRGTITHRAKFKGDSGTGTVSRGGGA